MAEQIDLKKAVTSPFTGVYWIKTLMYGLGLSALLFVGFAVYKAYFKKPLPTQNITVGQGGTVAIHNDAAKRHLILFAEPFVSVATNDDMGIGIRAGVRWEF